MAIRDCPVPVIGRVNGFCLGAGLEVAASCDIRVAADTAQFGMPEVVMGLPSVIEAALLPGLIGWGRTREILMTGEMFSAAEALAMGFVQKVVPASELDAAVDHWLAAICRATPEAVRSQKALMNRWERVSVEEGIFAGIDALSEAYTTGEPQAAIGAFLRGEGQERLAIKPRRRHAPTLRSSFDKRRRLLKHASVMRTRQIRGEVQDVGYGGRASAHANAGPTGEPSAGRDEQVGQMFRNMRAAMGVSRETIARRLATSPSTIDNFEAGAISALPHWKETARIVRSYCELLRMDARADPQAHPRPAAGACQPTEVSRSASAAGAAIGQNRAHRTPCGQSRARAGPAHAPAPRPHAVCAQCAHRAPRWVWQFWRK